MITLITTQCVTFVLLIVSELLPFFPGTAGGIIKAILNVLSTKPAVQSQKQNIENPKIVTT
jgi:hypothetical protein